MEQLVVSELIMDIIFKYSGVKLAQKDFVYHGRALYFKIKPIAKSEILLKQKRILKDLQEHLGIGAPKRLL